MNNFIQRKRLIEYSDRDCKKFLSKDFLHTCCYCLVREGDLGGTSDFEKDHFIPKSKNGTDFYDNLNYACRFCNGKSGKSDYFSNTFLNPRVDDIWEKHIYVNENFYVVANTSEGQEFIDHIRLNRKAYINKRKSIFEGKRKCLEKIEILKKKCQTITDDELKEELEKIISADQQIVEYGMNCAFNSFELDEDIETKFIQEIEKIGYCEEVNENYELLFKVVIDGREIFCFFIIRELFFNMGVAAVKIKMNYLLEWKKMNKDIAIVCYNSNDNKFYWENINCLKYDSSKQMCYCTLIQQNVTDNIDFTKF